MPKRKRAGQPEGRPAHGFGYDASRYWGGVASTGVKST